jgi:FlaA1/EpsC-like NDP-sugar epimerase
MNKRVIIIGAGGHGKVIADIIEKSGDKVVGFLDDNKIGKIFGYEIIGRIADIKRYQRNNSFVIAIGDNYLRKKIAENNDVRWHTAIHPSAQIAKGVEIIIL